MVFSLHFLNSKNCKFSHCMQKRPASLQNGRSITISIIVIAFSFLACRKRFDNTANARSIPDSSGIAATEEGPVVYPATVGNSISGYSDRLSYYPGDTVHLYLSGPAQHRAVIPLKDVNNVTIFSITADISPQKISTAKPWVDGLGYTVSSSTVLPFHLKSGVYYWNSVIPLIVKSREPKDITVVYPSNTLNAYCTSGGKSLYGPEGNRAFVVSFHRFYRM